MQTVTPSLTFKDGAEDALKLYVSVIRNSKIVNIMRSDGRPLPKGHVLHATFELDGREFTAMDGGPTLSFSEGISSSRSATRRKSSTPSGSASRRADKKDRAAGSRIDSACRGRSFPARWGR